MSNVYIAEDPASDKRTAEILKEIVSEAAVSFDFGERSDGIRDIFNDLAARTVAAASVARDGWMQFTDLREKPWSSFFFLNGWARLISSGHEAIQSDQLRELVGEWWLYSGRYYKMRDRSPVLELHDHLFYVSESVSGSSWSGLVQTVVRDWVDGGADTDSMPFDDVHGYVTRKVASRLSAIRRATGRWIYGNDLFMTDEQARELRQHPDPSSFEAEVRRTRPCFEGI